MKSEVKRSGKEVILLPSLFKRPYSYSQGPTSHSQPLEDVLKGPKILATPYFSWENFRGGDSGEFLCEEFNYELKFSQKIRVGSILMK